MRRTSRFVLVPMLLAAAVFGAAALGQDAKLCSKCKTTGKIANPLVDEKWQKLEAGCLHCSERLERDSAGHGFETLPCKGCLAVDLAKTATADFDAKAKIEDDWLAERRKIDAALKPRTRFMHIETAHFQLAFGIDKVVLADKTTYDAHAAAHLYAKRLEDFYSWFQKLLLTDDKEARNLKHQVFLMGDERTVKSASEQYTSLPSDRAARAVGDPSVLTTWRNKAEYKSDAAFHQHVVHHIAHNLCGVFYLKAWLVDDAGWLEEGIAHLAEMELFDKSGNWFTIEGAEEARVDQDWQPPVRKMASLGNTLPFAELMTRKAFMLTPDEHYLAWSYTDFLYRRKPEGLREMIRQLKDKKLQRDVLRDVYQLTTTRIDEEWRKWVLANYRTMPKLTK